MSNGAKIGIIVGGIALVALIAVPLALGDYFCYDNYGWGTGAGMMGNLGTWWYMPVMIIAIGGLIIWGIVAMVRRTSPAGGFNSGHSIPVDTALDTLKKRYARGEISKEQFDEMKRELN